MHLFGHKSGPHLAHVRARCLADQAELTWEVHNAGEVHWRVLRSESEYADRADALPGGTQTAVMDGLDTCVVDRVEEGRTYYYTVFAQDERGEWHRQARVKLRSEDDFSWRHDSSTTTNQSPLPRDLLFEACEGKPIEHMQALAAPHPLHH